MGINLVGLSMIGSLFAPNSVQLSTYGDFSMLQTIQQPAAQVGFIDGDNNIVSEPSVSFPIQTSSLKCLTYENGAPKAYLGSEDQNIFVSVPNDFNGWGLSIIDGGEWLSNDTAATLSLNDNYAQGCLPNPEDSYRIGSLGGLMYVDPTSIEISNDCLYSCENTNIEVGELANFAEVENLTIPLIYNLTPNEGWQGKIRNIGLTQTLPANIPPGNYSAHMGLSLQLL